MHILASLANREAEEWFPQMHMTKANSQPDIPGLGFGFEFGHPNDQPQSSTYVKSVDKRLHVLLNSTGRYE